MLRTTPVWIIALLMVTMAFLVAVPSTNADIPIDAPFHTGIVIDGLDYDWEGINGTTISLMQPLAPKDTMVDSTVVKVTYDDSNIYVLVRVTDDLDYNSTDNHNSSSIAILWQIDDTASVDMGGGTGKVDIWHWELQTDPGVQVGKYLYSGNDPTGNCDDEVAWDRTIRKDDGYSDLGVFTPGSGQNELTCAWSHTNMSDDANPIDPTGKQDRDGDYIFEFSRSLTTGNDTQDVQFVAGGSYKMVIAYWDRDVSDTWGWSDSDHYTSGFDLTDGTTETWLNVTLSIDEPVTIDVPEPIVPDPVVSTGGKFTIDGSANDWAAIPGTTISLKQPLPPYTEMVDALTYKVTNDENNIYVLIQIEDDFDYNETDHRKAPAIGVLWQIDDAATTKMGGGLGAVDIWHWELDTGPGVVAGFNLLSGNDPVGNLDDEWATDTTVRKDDGYDALGAWVGGQNEIVGSWSHSNMTDDGRTTDFTGGQNRTGVYTFEMMRPLKTADTNGQDAQFTLGEVARMSIAYWDPDEDPSTGEWSDEGHFTTCRDPASNDFAWIPIDIVDPNPPVEAPTPQKPTGGMFTIDGLNGDWANVPGVTIDMMQPTPPNDVMAGALTYKVANDGQNIYVLVEVEDTFDYRPTNHHLSPAIAVLFAIDDSAGVSMGGGSGNVDIWHWELDSGPGELAGYNLYSGNDPAGNLDDEWAYDTTIRWDDGKDALGAATGGQNELLGAWSHTNMAFDAEGNGTGNNGTWIFEMMRPLHTADVDDQDVQFDLGETYKMAIAYWDPSENATSGWSDVGHYTTCKDVDTKDFSWIEIDIVDPSPAASTPDRVVPTGGMFTIDGLDGDWSNVPGTTVSLKQPVPPFTEMADVLEYKITNDAQNIYVLMKVADDFDYWPTDHHKSPAIAVLFEIDDGATPSMGGGTGNVDIWHWELDTGPGVVTGFNLFSGNDPIGNLDDEWAHDTTDRHDDSGQNEIIGSWSHTNMAYDADGNGAGGSGYWIFEMMRPLKTADAVQDAQFELGAPYKVSFAYWDPSENSTSMEWSDSGHFTTCKDLETNDFSWIEANLTDPSVLDIDFGEIDLSDLALSTTTDAINATVADLETSLTDLNTTLSTDYATRAALSTADDNANQAITDAGAAKKAADSADSAAGSASLIGYIALALGVLGLILGAVAMMMARKGGAPSESAPPEEDD